MGASSSNENNKNGYIIWIDKNVNNEENTYYIKYLQKRNFIIHAYDDIQLGLNEILYNKEQYFKDIYIILSGSFYQDFILKFKNQLQDIYVASKIVIFTKDKESFLENNSKIKDIIDNKFYNLGGIQTLFKGVYEDFLIKKFWKKEIKINNKPLNSDINGEQYTFEYINDILELYLPVFYKSLIKLNENDSLDELTHYLYDTYKGNNFIKELFEPIVGIENIPLGILCKYYARLYTMNTQFYKDLNESLRKSNLLLKEEELLFSANKNNYHSITFIKSFYEGIKLGIFHVDLKEKLYRFSWMKQEEINNIKEYITKKKPGIPAANFFSKTFLSFSEDEKVVRDFYEDSKNNKINYEKNNLVPVFFHLIKEVDINESLFSHIKIDDISVYPDEKEILFLPFTSFEILKVIPKTNVKSISNKKKPDYYIIELTYLGKYEKELKNIEKEVKIPNTIFRSYLEEPNLIEANQDITNKKITNKYDEYERSCKKRNNDIYIIYEVKEENLDENHYVQIFGRNLEENGTDFVRENKDKIKIIINNEEKALEYKYKLKKGYNKVVIKLNSEEIDNLGYMFCGCSCLKTIDGLRYLDTKNIKDFSKMFYGCNLLKNINALENWDVSNGNNFEGMFAECNLLKNINALENWNVSNGNNFRGMFYNCELLLDIKGLQNWDVSNGKDFEAMFRECKSLSKIEALKKWNVSNGNNFSNMFYGCKSLSYIKELESWIVSKGNNFEGMFAECNSLNDINALEKWDVLNGNNFLGMFYNCKLLTDITALQNWNVSNGINFSKIFWGCELLLNIKGLQNWNVLNGKDFEGMFYGCKLLSEIKALENWNVSKGTNFSRLFYLCNSLSDIKGLQNWNVSNGNTFSYIFYECTSLSDIKSLENWDVSKSNNFECMFYNCKSLPNINGLQNWNVSHGNIFGGMFWGCESLSDIKGLQKWDVSNGYNFSGMFFKCISLSEVNALEKWNVSNGNNFDRMFCLCRSLSDITALENWNVSNGKSFLTMFSGCYSLSNFEPIWKWNTNGYLSILMTTNGAIIERYN